MKGLAHDPYFLAAAVLTLAHVVLIWAFRFIPLYDYPMWLYEAHIMQEIADPAFSKYFEMVYAPIPNLGFVGMVYLLGTILPLEIAGKLFLTMCVIGLPWSFLYCVRAVNNGVASWAEYAAFPFSFCIYFFSGQGFFLGLSFLFLSIGFLHSRWESKSIRIILMFTLLIAYFIHALILLLMVSVLVGYALRSGLKRQRLLEIGFGLVPTAGCAIVYLMAFTHFDKADMRWGFWFLGQSIFKSLFLFTRSYGHSNPLPLTILNALWLVFLSSIGLRSYRLASRHLVLNTQFKFPVILCLVFMVLLPTTFSGVVNPGARFGLPLVLLFILMTSKAKIPELVKPMFLVAACSVLTYNAFHFHRVDERMQRLYTDLESVVDSSGTFAVVRFDWPSEREIANVGASSIDPLFGAMYYLALERRNVGAIFETAALRFRPVAENLMPLFKGQSRQEFASSLIAQRDRFLPFRYLIFVGKNEELDRFANAVSEIGFKGTKTSEFWKIMVSTRQNK